MHSADDKKKLAHRLRRISGQVEAIQRMIEQDKYCVDILMQLSAATGALGKVGQIVLENHLQCCIREAMTSGTDADRDEKIKELLTLFEKYSKVLD